MALALVAPAAVLMVAPSAAAPSIGSSSREVASSPAATAPAGTVEYAVGVRTCKAPKPGTSSCYAMWRKVVTKGTANARPFVVADGAAKVPASTIGPAGGLTPSDLAKAYGLPTSGGAGETVAIVDAYNDPNIDADLQTFDTEYDLAACSTSNGCLQVVNQTGGSSLPSNDKTGWSNEESLDVETVHAVCQGCKIVLLEASSQSNSDLETAEDTAVSTFDAGVVSNSYGSDEASYSATNAAAYNHPGTVIVASTGDDGYYDYDLLGEASPSPYNQPNDPAALSTVVAAGGTSLYLGQTATRQSETVWNDNGTKDYNEALFGEPFGASGGGCSNVTTAPAWQSALSDWAKTDCGTHRLVADVAADADYLTGFDVYDSYACSECAPVGWETFGGTSLAAPIISAAFALAGGAHGVAYPALTLYGHLGTSSLFDVASGGNGYCGGEGAAACGDPNKRGEGILDCDYPATGTTASTGDAACDALSGYDGPTGVGTPKGGIGAFMPTGPSAKISGPTSVASGVDGTWTATATDPFPGGTVTSYSWNWGDGTTPTVTSTGSATHDYAAAGSETITLTMTDSYGQTGTATYAVTVT
ncbi:MAG: PKD domain-containing protein [Acidimicrobiales bacterium]